MPRFLLASLVLVPVLAGSTPADELKAPLARLNLSAGDTIVFLGDSITQQCLYTQYLEDYFYTRFPGMRLRFHNAGVSGDTVADALSRFDRDVAAYKPRYVTILLGTNDGAAQRFDEALFDRYRTDLQKLIGRIRDIGATPVLITPPMYDARAKQLNPKPDSRGRGGYYNGVMALYGAWLRDLAVDGGYGFADVYGVLNQFTNQGRKTKPAFTLIPDGIHPDPSGQVVMLFAIITDLGLSRRIATIDLARADDGRAIEHVTGGTVRDARYHDDGLDFTFLPASLPLPVPAGAQVGAQMIPLGHRLSYEALFVHGLRPGRYRLLINDQVVGEYPSHVLETKLELESLEKTPQYQQAVRVCALNARRNEQAVVPLRNLWRSRKTLDRTKRELEQSPEDPALKKRAASLERSLAHFDDQVEAFERTAQQIEDRIFQENQPKPLYYRIARLSADGQ